MFCVEVAYKVDSDVLGHTHLRNERDLLTCNVAEKNTASKHVESNSPQKLLQQVEKLTVKPLLQEVGTQRTSNLLAQGC